MANKKTKLLKVGISNDKQTLKNRTKRARKKVVKIGMFKYKVDKSPKQTATWNKY